MPAVAGSNVPALVLVMPVPDQVPPEVVADKFIGLALTHNEVNGDMVASAFGVTVTNAVSVFPQDPEMVYVIVNVPVPEVAGSNVPPAPDVIPVPDQLPPPVTAFRLKAGEPKQRGATLLMVASANNVTVIVTVEVEAGQGAFEILHWKTFAPIPNPVIPELGEEGVVIVPDPLISVHVPVPVVAAFPAREAVVPHMV
jgi:hypothetical protein